MGGSSKGAPAPAAPKPADLTAEYTQRRSDLAAQRDKDLAAQRARMAAGGLSESSAGWQQGLTSINTAYDDKLKTLSADPYFSSINKIDGFGTWG